jgi:hypothetical protein
MNPNTKKIIKSVNQALHQTGRGAQALRAASSGPAGELKRYIGKPYHTIFETCVTCYVSAPAHIWFSGKHIEFLQG